MRNGPFASVDDLLAVRGIGPVKLAELRALVRV
jgi:DNA uptake protein ComE-like DNA-binding protein